MIKVSIAGLNVGIDNRFDFIEKMTADYVSDKGPLDFSVSVTPEQLSEEAEMSEREYSDGYLESVAVYRSIAERLPDFGGAVFHGAVIANEGKAYAVTARSGVGKTTHLSLWLRAFGDKVHILNGDKPIIRDIDGTVYAAGTPWRGKENFGVNEMLPLAGIAFLERAESNSAQKISPTDALIPFISQIYIPKGPRCAALALSLANKVISSVPLFSFKVNMDIEAAHIAYKAFIKGGV